MAEYLPLKLSSSPLTESTETILPSLKKDAAHDRNLADFPLSKWTDYFTECSLNEAEMSTTWSEVEELKTQMRRKLDLLVGKPEKELVMIDVVERLGLGYQFQDEIEQTLKSMSESNTYVAECHLLHTSLYFRLLRQHGYNVTSSVYSKFMDSDGLLKENLFDDVLGMLSFYEAAQLRMHADAVILDKALTQCVTRLASMVAVLSPSLQEQVRNALKQPIHKDLQWLGARNYISTYDNDSHDPTLLKLAKLHFNFLQKLHRQELSEVSKWWRNHNIPTKCPFARDRLVESYIWGLAMYYQPHYSLPRKIFTKVVAFLTVLDDCYDAYGTDEELKLLTESIRRCDTYMFEQVPDYGRTLCQILLDLNAEIEEHLAKEGRSYCMPYVKESMANQPMYYHNEYLWFKKNRYPTMEEYRKLAFESSGTMVCIIYSLAGMGDIVTKADFEWVLSHPKMLIGTEVVCRYQDDIVSHEFEQQREHFPSSVQCYMNQYGVSKQEAIEELSKQIADAWKDVNEGCHKPRAAASPVIEMIRNFARLIHVFYRDGDSMTHPTEFLEETINLLLIDPVAI